MNDVPVIVDLLTLNILLFDKNIVVENLIWKFPRKSVQKYGKTVRLLRNNYDIGYVSNNNAVFHFFVLFVTPFSTDHSIWSHN